VNAKKLLVTVALTGLSVVPVKATWSIVLGDSSTGEVAVGTVTCLTSFDLLAIIPVVLVERGAAAVQASGDFEGIRRPVIFDGLLAGDSPMTILDELALIAGHESRQYGIVDTQARTLTFSGNQTLAWTGGLSGTDGTLSYAIQGNILTGACVVNDIELAILNTPGDIPDKLMAGMQAARTAGGDSRCSCPGPDPEACGCPVPVFDKSGHIGTMVVARPGDSDDDECNLNGCADGDYFLTINVPNQTVGAPDPVDQLQSLFDSFRQDHLGRPDAGQTEVSFQPSQVPPNGTTTQTMVLQLNDWQGLPATSAISSVQVTHASESDGLSTIGAVTNMGGGLVNIELTAGTGPGTDVFQVVVNDGIRPVQLMPNPGLEFDPLGDLDGDGSVEVPDLIGIINTAGPCPGGDEPCLADLNGNGTVAIDDFLLALANWP